MKSGIPYHTALTKGHPYFERAEPCLRHEWPDGSVALQYDVTAGPLPADFDRCDAFYVEPPWPPGVKTFDERAGIVSTGGFNGIYARVAEVAVCGRPVAVMTSKGFVRKLPEPRLLADTFLNGADVLVAIYGPAFEVDTRDSHAIIRSMAAAFDCIGDFCCGYGTTARIVRAAGKRFVCSDYNARCIGYMARWL